MRQKGMTKASDPDAPSASELAARLGKAQDHWTEIIESVSANFAPVEQVWKSSKNEFGRMCLLKQKKRTLLYIIPEDGVVQAAIVLGDRAVAIALASGLDDKFKNLIRQARPYAEGRGIRFDVISADDVSSVVELIRIKTTPK